jgi:hypothetical protein
MTWLARICKWFRDGLGLPPLLVGVLVEEPPETIETQRVYLVADGHEPWSAGLACPCGCGEFIQLSLLSRDRPHWRAQRHWNGTVTLYPSVWRIKGCRSHFFVTRGQIQWVRTVTQAPRASQPSDQSRVDTYC